MEMIFLIIPIIIFTIGLVFKKCPPKNINGIIGYRSKISKLNTNAWNFANEYCAKLLIKSGIILFFFSLIPQFLLSAYPEQFNEIIISIIIIIQLFFVIIPALLTEKALKEKFNDKT